MDTVIVALIASVLGPGVLALLLGWQRKSERREDWARQDAVADQAAKAAKLLLDAQAETIRKTDEVAEVAAKGAARIGKRLGVIHDLVNSNVTILKQSDLDGARRELIMLTRLIARDPSDEDKAALDATRAKILDLESELAERHTQQEILDAAVEDGAA